MKRSNGIIALYVAAVFGGGAVTGAFGHYLWTETTVSATTKRKPEDFRRAYISEMRSRLSLSDEQASQIEKILDRTRERYREFRERTKPEMDQIHNDQTNDIKSVLRPEQMIEYDKMRIEREEKRKKSPRGL
jgi:Spy/CpxP family protein refolding chaperone